MKKSYMNKSNLINERFFDKLIKKIKDKSIVKKLKKDKKLNTHLSNLNKTTQSFEDELNGYLKSAGEKPIKLDKYTLKDFI